MTAVLSRPSHEDGQYPAICVPENPQVALDFRWLARCLFGIVGKLDCRAAIGADHLADERDRREADYCVRWAIEGLVARGFTVDVPQGLTRGIARPIAQVVAEDFADAPVRLEPAA